MNPTEAARPPWALRWENAARAVDRQVLLANAPQVTSPTDTAPANCSSLPRIPKLNCDTKGNELPGKTNKRK